MRINNGWHSIDVHWASIIITIIIIILLYININTIPSKKKVNIEMGEDLEKDVLVGIVVLHKIRRHDRETYLTQFNQNPAM